MKKISYLSIVLTCLVMLVNINVYATSGYLRKDSIITCNKIKYGRHGKDNHWHIASRNSNGSYSAVGGAMYKNPCNSKVKTTKKTTKKITKKINSTKKQKTTTKKTLTSSSSTSTSATKKVIIPTYKTSLPKTTLKNNPNYKTNKQEIFDLIIVFVFLGGIIASTIFTSYCFICKSNPNFMKK